MKQHVTCFAMIPLLALAALALPGCHPDPCSADPMRRECVISDRVEDLWPDPAHRTRVYLSTIANQIREYAQRTGRLPASLAEMFPGDPGTAPGKNRLDAWQRELGYTPVGSGRFELRSAGLDGIMGTADDVVETAAVQP